jgi:hypothetical protein
MLTTITAAAISALAGVAIGASVSTGRGLRLRVGTLEQHVGWLGQSLSTALPSLIKQQEDVQQVLPDLVTRQEVSSAFAELANIERQRVAAAQRSAPVAPSEPLGRPSAMGAQELNAAMTQQLAALNERLQQVTSQRMPG